MSIRAFGSRVSSSVATLAIAIAMPLSAYGGSAALHRPLDRATTVLPRQFVEMPPPVDFIARTASGFADFAFTDVTTHDLADTVVTHDKKGVAFVDYDRDGDADLCIAGEGARAVTLLRNDGGSFVDVTAGDLAIVGSGCSQSWADFDDDGDLDLWLVYEEYQSFLFRNDGGDTFVNVTQGAFLQWAHGHSVAWVDVDLDGDVEAYQANLKQPSVLVAWNGTTWEDVATDSLATLRGDGIAWGDYDDDGDPDVYLARFAWVPSLMLRNDREAGFRNATFGDLAWAGNGHTAAFADYDNDGRLDLFVGVANRPNRLLHNEGGGAFTLATPANVAVGFGIHSVGPCWGDYDNDGDLDLFLTVSDNQPCHMFRNDGGGVFTDVTSGPLVGTGSNAGAANADYDRDGDLDLYLGSYWDRRNLLLRNELANGNHWLQMSLTGVTSNTAALGARIEIVADGRRQIREIVGNTGFRGHSDYVVHFGLGTAMSVDSIRVRWPCGIRWDTTDVAVDTRLELIERDPLVAAPGPGVPPRLALSASPNPARSPVRLAVTLPRAGDLRLHIVDLQGRRVMTLADEARVEAGTRTFEWSLATDRGGRVRPGVYIARLESGGDRTWRKLVVAAP